MIHLKLLTILAGLALLTACGGAATPTPDNAGGSGGDDPCEANPFGTTCTNPTETQQVTFCRDEGKTTDTKTDDCARTVRLVCTANVFDDLCTTPTQQEAEAFCGDATKTTDSKTDDCAQTIKTACTANVFDLILCTANEYVQQRNNFNSMCINQTGKTKEICDAEALVRTCAANPFMNTCLMDTGAIALRQSRCLADTTIDDSCRGAQGIATLFCAGTPFNTSPACVADTGAIALRQSMCLANIMIDDSCRGEMGIATVFCEDDPFNTATACVADAYNDERLMVCAGESTSNRCTPLVTPICEQDFRNALCRGRTKYDEQLRCSVGEVCVVNHADWVEGFDTPPNTAGDYTREETFEFLQGTEVGLDAGSVKLNFNPPEVLTLNLEPLGGEAKNGVAWFQGASGATGNALPLRYYSGIFSGTSLGAPLTSADASVSVPWAGRIGASYLSSDGKDGTPIANNTDFDLTVDFANSEIRAFVNRTGADHVLLKAEFDDTGRFDGTIIHATFAGGLEAGAQTKVTNGVLTGIIGKQGAVGAFYGGADDTDDSQGIFRGGFVAAHPTITARVEAERLAEEMRLQMIEDDKRMERERIARELLESQVTYTDWIGGFGVSPPPATPTSPTTNQFLAGTTTLDPLTSITPLTLTSTIGGVGFFTENGAYYAGLLANTNVGLPVAITPQASGADVTATWPGKIRAIQVFDGSGTDTTTALDLNVVVNLTARTFTATRRDPNANSTTITINGLFPAINNGVVTGTVTQRANVFTRNGQLTGIIGQNGVVGAFYSDSNVATEHRYVGGFYAAPSNN